MRTRTTLTIGFMAVAAMTLLAGCQKVERPAIGGNGPVALQAVKTSIMPPYHTPENWRKVHMDEILSGRVAQTACLPCHSEPEKFCNNCHSYVGVKKVFTEGKTMREMLGLQIIEGLQPTPDHAPLENWRTTHDDAIIYGQAAISACLGCHAEPDQFCNKCHEGAGVRKITAQ
ncbi:MAG: hypothetical protein WC291_07975 [Thermodesulfovibrionales bacterium]|jgi:hypothetical protein